jgi:hypothetical protein
VLWTWDGDQTGAHLGNLGDALGDLDGDGYDDVLTSEPEFTAGTTKHAGRILVFSGKDGSPLLQVDGDSQRNLGGLVCGTGDVDGDGAPDLAVGNFQQTRVTLLSGATGAPIRGLKSPRNPADSFGTVISNAGDLDGDSVPDLLVGESDCYYNADAIVVAFSGKTGSVIWQTSIGYCGYSSLGYILRVVDDLNGDGFPEWCVGSQNSPPSGGNQCQVKVYSGKDGSFLSYINEPQWLYQCWDCTYAFGAAIAPAGDVDGDAVPDLAISDPRSLDRFGGDVFFYSGLDGTMLFHFSAAPGALALGIGLEGGVDFDHDGHLDVLAGDTYDATNGLGAGSASQFEIGPLILDATPRFVAPNASTIRIALQTGPTGNPAGLFLLDVNGTPHFALLQAGAFDAYRRWSQFFPLPPGFRGNTLTLRAYALDANGHLVASNDETIMFQ